jgi:hypothetical protein
MMFLDVVFAWGMNDGRRLEMNFARSEEWRGMRYRLANQTSLNPDVSVSESALTASFLKIPLT